jgi:diguanylate cyclase (GGDEF)-like protein
MPRRPDSTEQRSATTRLDGLRRQLFEAAAHEDRPEPVLALLCNQIEERLEDACCCATLVSPTDHSLRLVAAPSLPFTLRKALASSAQEPGAGLAPIAQTSGETVISPDVASDPRWSRHRDKLVAAGFKATCSVPTLGIAAGDRPADERSEASRAGTSPLPVLGTLELFFRRAGAPPDAVLDTLALASALAGSVLQALRAREQLRQQRSFDPVTDLPNRRLFGIELERALEDADPRRDRLALLLLDLDHFKELNDTVGYAVGDSVLQATADRLAGLRGSSEIVARLGDDDFALLMTSGGDSAHAEQRAQEILAALRVPYDFGGQPLALTASAGLGLFPWDGHDPGTLLRTAQKALQEAKRHGRNCLRVYTATLGTADFDSLELKTSLHVAVEEGELDLEYQPIIEAGTGAIHAVEALATWNHPRRGRLPAARFISLAEETGLISQIGEWTLVEACAEAARWRRATGRPIRLTVNIAANHFQERGFVERIRTVLQETGLPADSLVLEITERTATSDVERASQTMRALAGTGVRIALDDFGTGYSSMDQLKRFVIHWLKIDRSFVSGLPHYADNRAIVRAILAMARALKLTVVAEGVETEDEAAFLAEEGCELLQGYHFSRALPPETLAKRLSES